MTTMMDNLGSEFRLYPGIGTATAGTTQTQAGATALVKGVTLVTAGNTNDGVVLPAGLPAGQLFVVVNKTGADNLLLKIYPPSGGAINGGSANAALATVSGAVLISIGGNGYYALIDQDTIS